MLSKETGISKAALSRALGDCSGVNAQIRSAAKAAAEKYCYSGKQKKDFPLTVILPDTPHYFWDLSLKGINDALGPLKFRLSRITNLHDFSSLEQCIKKAVSHGVRALILPVPNQKTADLLAKFDEDIIIFQLCEYRDIINSFQFSSDGYSDGQRLAKALLSAHGYAQQNLYSESYKFAKIPYAVLLDSYTQLSSERSEGFRSVYPEEYILDIIEIPDNFGRLLPSVLARLITDKGLSRFELLICNDGILPAASATIKKLGMTGKAFCAGYEYQEKSQNERDRNICVTVTQDIYSESFAAASAAAVYIKTGVFPDRKKFVLPSSIFNYKKPPEAM